MSQQGDVGAQQQTDQIPSQRTPTRVAQGREAAEEVGGEARQQAQAVAEQAKAQARQATDQLRERIGDETQSQVRRITQNLRGWADDLASMAEVNPDSPVCGVVQDVARGGRRAADHLDERGMEGLAQDIQGFARRRPVTFLAGAAVAGFVVGRLIRATAKGQSRQSSFTPSPGGDRSVGVNSEQVHRAAEELT